MKISVCLCLSVDATIRNLKQSTASLGELTNFRTAMAELSTVTWRDILPNDFYNLGGGTLIAMYHLFVTSDA